MAEQDIERKVSNIIEKYDSYKKNMHRETKTQERNERIFIQLLAERFFVAAKESYRNNAKSKGIPCEQPNFREIESDVLPLTVADADVGVDISNAETTLNVNSADIVERVSPLINENIEISDDPKDPDFETSLSKHYKSKFSCSSSSSPTSSSGTGIVNKIVNSGSVSSVLDRCGISGHQFTLLCGAIAGRL